MNLRNPHQYISESDFGRLKTEVLTALRKKGTLHIEKNNLNDRRGQKEAQHFSNTDRTVNIDYLVKISCRNEGEIKTFSDEGKLRKFAINRPMLK